MPQNVIEIIFKNTDQSTVFNLLQRARAFVYMANKGHDILAVILNDARVLNIINHSSAVSDKFTIRTLPHVKTGPFNGLVHVEAKKTESSVARVLGDTITPNELLKGWGKFSSDRLCSVRVFVDEKPAAEAAINRFRADLLREGIGNGCYGFSVRLPKWALDGGQHKVTIELIEDHGETKTAIDSFKKVMKLPLHFNLPRPWVGDGSVHAGTWDSQKEIDYINLRNEVINNDLDRALPRVSQFIDINPQAIFLDFGIKDRSLIDDTIFEPF